MAHRYDINECPTDDEPSTKHETHRAKLYLQKFCPEAGDNLYDHLSEVLNKVLAERPKNAFASFDEYSRRLRDEKYRTLQANRLRDVYVPPVQFADAKKLIKLFQVVTPVIDEEHESLEENEDLVETPIGIPNIFDLLFYFEQTDIGLPRAEIVFLNLSIRKLIDKTKIQNVRFWGKILGRPRNYYVVEANLSDFELERRLEELERGSEEEEGEDGVAKEAEQDAAEKEALDAALATKLSDIVEENEAESEEDDSLKLEFPPIPENKWKPPPEVTPERIGVGANAKVYFVCNSPGRDDWVELPAVTPQQIVVARQIVHIFTGNLEAEMHTFPPFPGNEKNYLRAQIARIGAATLVSPIGYFTLGNEDGEEEEIEEDEEEGEEGEIRESRNYEPLPIKELIDPSMSNWCHHSPIILKQGRIIWQQPGKSDDGDEDGDEDEDEEEDEGEEEGTEGEGEGRDKGYEKEIGPPLLTPLSEDAASDYVTPWTARQSSRIQPDTAVALIRSNVWPGAFAFAVDKKFANLYVGWGHKHNIYNYSPPGMPPVQDQYSIDSELVEIRDPTFDEEEEYRIAHLPPHPDDEEEEEESEEETEDDEKD